VRLTQQEFQVFLASSPYGVFANSYLFNSKPANPQGHGLLHQTGVQGGGMNRFDAVEKGHVGWAGLRTLGIICIARWQT